MRIVGWSMVLAVAAAPASAQDKPGAEVIRKVAECRAITGDAERLACFDAASAALATAVAKRDVVVLDREEVRRTRRSLFGFSLPKLPFFGGGDKADDKAGDAPDPEDVVRLDTPVTQVAPFGYGLYTVVLAEGGTWRFTEADRAIAPRVGDKIAIKRGLIGNYMASLNGRRALRITRSG